MALTRFPSSAGNAFTALLNQFIGNADGTSKLPGASYYLFFAGLMAVAAVIWVLVARVYKPKYYLQDSAAPQSA